MQKYYVTSSVVLKSLISTVSIARDEPPFVGLGGFNIHHTKTKIEVPDLFEDGFDCLKTRSIFHFFKDNTHRIICITDMPANENSDLVYWTDAAPLFAGFNGADIPTKAVALFRIVCALSDEAYFKPFTETVLSLAATRNAVYPTTGNIGSPWTNSPVKDGVANFQNTTVVAIALSDMCIAASIIAAATLNAAGIEFRPSGDSEEGIRKDGIPAAYIVDKVSIPSFATLYNKQDCGVQPVGTTDKRVAITTTYILISE